MTLKKQIFRLIVTFPSTLPKIKLTVLLKVKYRLPLIREVLLESLKKVLHTKEHFISHACFKYVLLSTCIDNLCKLNIKYTVKPFPGNSI